MTHKLQATSAFLTAPNPQHPAVLHASTTLPNHDSTVIFVLSNPTRKSPTHPFACMLGALSSSDASSLALLTTTMLPSLSPTQLRTAHTLLASMGDTMLHLPPRHVWADADLPFLQGIAVAWHAQLGNVLVPAPTEPSTVLDAVHASTARATLLSALVGQLDSVDAAAIMDRLGTAPIAAPLKRVVQSVRQAAEAVALERASLLPLERACLALRHASLQVAWA